MKDLGKFVIGAILVLIAIGIGLALLKAMVALLIPVAILAVIGYILYNLFGGKSLGGGGNGRLP
ncbi:MAG: hypothetical protein KatS3mg015_2297 [Fimbriimonadales bacterium]|nr:MAG: hypothetical protein KatS3mg015_2297 [Fimbriimonadales bacterium]